MGPLIATRFDGGISWSGNPPGFLERSSAALVDQGRVWLIDPLWTEGIEPELAALGTVVAIIMTLRWHERDVNRFARRFDVPVYLSRQLLLQAERNRRRRPILVDLDVPIQYVD